MAAAPVDGPARTRRPRRLPRVVTTGLVAPIVAGTTVVRESVKMLQEKGLVRVRHGSGTVIAEPDSWNSGATAAMSRHVTGVRLTSRTGDHTEHPDHDSPERLDRTG